MGEVVDVQKHPNADKLTVCTVNVGKETLGIVCGAQNVVVGQRVPVGLVGAVVPRDQHDPAGKPFELKEVKIRGVESRGMICSPYELDLGEDRDGIMVLEGNAKVGVPLAEYLGLSDVVYDIEITANRGDWLSHFGVVREISAMTAKPWRAPVPSCKETKEPILQHASVKILDKKGCPRYVARVFRNITIKPSPPWMQRLLTAAGVRPINNVVDITNFVMLETGQPLHAFDYDKLKGHAIVVRCAEEGEKFYTLDGKERTLSSDTLMICDAEGPVAIAGVMGGLNSEISETTENVLLESAYFDAVSIRRTAKRLALSTEASQRFERGADIEMTVYAANRAAELFQKLAGAEILKGSVDQYARKFKLRRVKIRISRTNAVLGTALTRAHISSLLKRLGLKIRNHNSDTLEATIPSYRTDLHQEIDLIEEVARMFGYNNIEVQTDTRIDFVKTGVTRNLEDEMRSYLVGAGFNEIVTNSLQNSAQATMTGEPPVEVLNPVSIGMQMLRTSMIPGVLDVVQNNINHGQKSLRLFEFGRVYKRDPAAGDDTLEGFHEESRLLLLLSGDYLRLHYESPLRKYDLFDLKGELEALLTKFFLDKYRLIRYDNGKPLSVNNLDVEIEGTYAGFLGTLKKEVAAAFEIEEGVFVAELNQDVLVGHWQSKARFRSLPRFPSVTRDLAFIVDDRLPQVRVEGAIREAGGALLRSVVLFDLFLGERIGAGKKSLAYALEFQAADHTLTDAEASELVSRIVRHVEETCGASLRAQEGSIKGV
ncbi:MAG: phenylalanine--tRNA ligase subunit beta [Ignavibacteriales bacterium]|nr:phenylalanine--tRNA ligase subunit beta [Ignavibacteriales bacterium]